MCLGKRIRAIREDRGIKASFVARRIGMTSGGYSGIESGRTKKIDINKIKQIADALGVNAKVFELQNDEIFLITR